MKRVVNICLVWWRDEMGWTHPNLGWDGHNRPFGMRKDMILFFKGSEKEENGFNWSTNFWDTKLIWILGNIFFQSSSNFIYTKTKHLKNESFKNRHAGSIATWVMACGYSHTSMFTKHPILAWMNHSCISTNKIFGSIFFLQNVRSR